MIIGVDIRVLARGSRTGIEEYTLNLLEHLFDIDQRISWKLFYNAFSKIELDYKWLSRSNVRLYKFNLPNRFIFDPLARFCELPKVDKLIEGVDCFFSPHFLLAPLSQNCPRVVTFHDLSFARRPDFFPFYKKFWHWSMDPMKQAVKARKIIAVSESTKKDLIDFYGIDDSRVKVVYPGVIKQKINDKKRDLIRLKYFLPEKFILYLGTIEPRKNLSGLIKSFELFKKNSDFSEFKLVIAGVKGWMFEDVFRLAKESFFSEDIIFTDFVAVEDKAYFYSLASLFIYPSFFEGFGFPPLEAMACGVPVIVSNTTSLPEVVGNAALMIDPYSIDEMAWAMETLIRDNNLRHELINNGLKRADQFCWENCAKQSLEILKNQN